MSKEHPSADPNVAAALVVEAAAAGKPAVYDDLESAWLAWSSHIQKVERARHDAA